MQTHHLDGDRWAACITGVQLRRADETRRALERLEASRNRKLRRIAMAFAVLACVGLLASVTHTATEGTHHAAADR